MPEVATLPKLNILFQGITGSTAYGLNHADSDVDRKAIFLQPTEGFLGLSTPVETYTSHDPDVEAHELGKFLRLVLQCNPNLVELLWLPENLIEVDCFVWRRLVANRWRLLHTKGVQNAYAGYAKEQITRLQRRNEEGKEGFASDIQKRTAKHARHCFRLFDQAKQLLTTGDMQVRVDNREELFAIGELPVRDLVTLFHERDAEFKELRSVLPDQPDRQWVDDVLVGVRKTGLQ